MNDDEILKQIRLSVVEETGAPSDLIIPTASAATVPGWDSLAHTRIIMNLENRIGTLLDMDATYQAATVQDLIGLVRVALQNKT
jgi:acyl carrier protein